MRLETGLVDRYLALIEPLDLVLIEVAANDVIAHFRHAGAGDEADIAGAEDCYLH